MSGAPRLLDLFCGAGGAAMGYARAGFHVVGVDVAPQPDYPFEFHQADALTFLAEHGRGFAVRHASPPCQAYSALTRGTQARYGRRHPDLLPATRAALRGLGPYVIENVPMAPMRRDLMLCGEMFGLGVLRHRFFELSWPVAQPPHPAHRGRVAGRRHGRTYAGPYAAVYGHGGGKGTRTDWGAAMGIDWPMPKRSLAEAIPPAFTRYIGSHLMEAFTGRAAPDGFAGHAQLVLPVAIA